jgi:BirA family biotin operon repressor/biotin-[acetyl-CoA-carboxylase] ligase
MSLLKPSLDLLSDGKFHSDKEISQVLGIPCKLVSKVLKCILDPTINLEIINHHHFRILGGLELLDAALIYNKLGKTKQLLAQLDVITLVDSTNNYLLEKIKCAGNYAVFSEQQTAGRGQFDRRWITSFGKNICLSLLWHFSNQANKLTGLSLVVGIAVVKALEQYGLKNIQLKWPNDIVHQEKKLGGILIESRSINTKTYAAVIGIGLNLYAPSTSSQAIDQAITDICSLQDLPPQRNLLAALILKNLLSLLFEFQNQEFAYFMPDWQRSDSLLNKPIKLLSAIGSREGIAKGINSQGQLCVAIEKKIHCFDSGEIRIKLKSSG